MDPRSRRQYRRTAHREVSAPLVMSKIRFGPDNPAATYVSHAFAEKTIDTGEAVINYAVAGTPDKPAFFLIPGKTASWSGYRTTRGPLAKHLHAFAVELARLGRTGST